MTIDEIIDLAPKNQIIQNTLMKMRMKLDHYKNPVCAVSGGSDSDTMIDIIERVRGNRHVTYVFFDTGIEYEATHRHLKFLEEKYGIEIFRRKASVPVTRGCKDYGQPFLSKAVSNYIDRLQNHGFRWEDEPFEVLNQRYIGCEMALRWFSNEFPDVDGKPSKFNISNSKWLREFIILNPPMFKISDKCCQGAKKNPGKSFDKELKCEIKMLGLRSAEGGQRSTAFHSCFSLNDDGTGNYRPLWFWSDEDKREYKEYYGLQYSDCYEVWGMTRTGCSGCPFGSRFEEELEIIHKYEPKLENAVNNIFGKSYEYTRAYRKYKAERIKQNRLNGQITMGEITQSVDQR